MKKMVIGIASQQAIRARALAIARGDHQLRPNESKISERALTRFDWEVADGLSGRLAVLPGLGRHSGEGRQSFSTAKLVIALHRRGRSSSACEAW